MDPKWPPFSPKRGRPTSAGRCTCTTELDPASFAHSCTKESGMRLFASFVLVGCLLVPAVSSAQSAMVVQGSAGPTLIDGGYSLAGGIGFSPAPALTISGNVERTYIASQFHDDGRGG